MVLTNVDADISSISSSGHNDDNWNKIEIRVIRTASDSTSYVNGRV